MISLRGLLIGLFAGVMFATGWLIFIDAQINTPDAFPAAHILPPLGVTLAAIMTNLVSVSRVHSSPQVKMWLFVWFTLACVCVGCSIWILVREYPPPVPNYPGWSILVQTVCTMFATFIFFIGRKPFASDYESF